MVILMSIEHKKYRILLLLAIVGLLLRLYLLDKQSLWNDEADEVMLLKRSSLFQLATGEEFDQSHPPLYHLALGAWTSVFGYSRSSVRLPSVLFGVAAIIGTYFIGKLIFNTETALAAAFLLAISPFHIMQSQIVRPYGLLILLGIINLYFFFKYRDTKKKLYLLAFTVTAILMNYTHYFAALQIATLNAALILWHRHAFDRRWIMANIIIALASLPLIALISKGLGQGAGARTFFSPLEIAYLAQMFSIGSAGFIFKLSTLKEDIIAHLPVLAITAAAYGYLLLTFVRDFSRWKKNNNITLLIFFILMPTILLYVSGFVYPLFRARYLSFIYPAVVLIISYVIANLSRPKLAFTVIAGLSIFSLSSYYFSYQSEPWEQICEYIEANGDQGDLILASRTKPFAYCYSGTARHQFILDMDEDQILAYPSIWLVLSNYRQSYAHETEELKDILNASYRTVDERFFKDDMNIISGDIIVYHFIRSSNLQ